MVRVNFKYDFNGDVTLEFGVPAQVSSTEASGSNNVTLDFESLAEQAFAAVGLK